MGHVNLALPGDGELLKAAGRVALAHGQLELMLRMTIKSLSGLTVREALDATQRTKNWELRDEILRLFKGKTPDPTLRLKLKAILGRCEHVSDDRNRLLHNAWALAADGSVVMKGDNHAWGPAATVSDLDALAEDITSIVNELNEVRLSGFIHSVCTQKKGKLAAKD
jgi:hypothetical protein